MVKSKSHANRGLDLEKDIQDECNRLKDENIAMLSKVPTEWKVLRAFKNGKSQIINAYTVQDSKFVDFVGISKDGVAIALEAKETKEKTSFPFKNISDYQYDFMDDWEKFKGAAYYIIRFLEHKRVFMVAGSLMKKTRETIGRKSIPYNWFLENKEVIELDYDSLNFIDYIR